MVDRDNDCRILALQITIGRIPFRLVCIYALVRQAKRSEFFRTLDPFLYGAHNLLVGRDFNCAIDGQRSGCRPINRELNQLISAPGLFDAWTAVHGNQYRYTWCNNSGAHSRIDRK